MKLGKRKERIKKAVLVIIAIFGMILIVFSHFPLSKKLKALLMITGVIIAVMPLFIYRYRRYRKIQEIEKRFPDYLRDLADAINSGMTLTQAVKHVSENEYGAFTPYARKIAISVDWGISFEKALEYIGEEIGSKVLKRAISTLIQTYRSGGKAAESLISVTESLKEIRKLKEERTSQVYSQTMQNYIIYFLFLAIIVMLVKFLLPFMIFPEKMFSGTLFSSEGMLLPGAGSIAIGVNFNPVTSEKFEIFKQMFLWLVVIEGIFSGLATGKMAEGSFIAGLKHALALTTIGYMIMILVL